MGEQQPPYLLQRGVQEVELVAEVVEGSAVVVAAVYHQPAGLFLYQVTESYGFLVL